MAAVGLEVLSLGASSVAGRDLAPVGLEVRSLGVCNVAEETVAEETVAVEEIVAAELVDEGRVWLKVLLAQSQ